METSVPLSFRFKGARTYVHGTDLYDRLIEAFEVEPPLRFLMRHNLTTGAVVVPCDPSAREALSAAASLLFRMGRDDERQVAVYADPNNPVTDRYAYDEDAIAESIQFGIESLAVAPNDRFTPIERIVAANKLLLQRSPQSIASQWWFARLDLDAHLARDAEYQLIFSRIRGQQFAESRIERDGAAIGRIYFFARGGDDRRTRSLT